MTDDDGLPCPLAMLGATMALMTAHAAAAADPPGPGPRPGHRRLIARKIVSNLFFLQAHPHLAPALRPMVAALHRRWTALCVAAGPLAETSPACIDDDAAPAGDDAAGPSPTLH